MNTRWDNHRVPARMHRTTKWIGWANTQMYKPSPWQTVPWQNLLTPDGAITLCGFILKAYVRSKFENCMQHAGEFNLPWCP